MKQATQELAFKKAAYGDRVGAAKSLDKTKFQARMRISLQSHSLLSIPVGHLTTEIGPAPNNFAPQHVSSIRRPTGGETQLVENNSGANVQDRVSALDQSRVQT
jgi:hypothetical protein